MLPHVEHKKSSFKKSTDVIVEVHHLTPSDGNHHIPVYIWITQNEHLYHSHYYLQADNLRALAERENNNSRTQHAYTAASAYSSIVQEIGDAKKAADEAEEGVRNITQVVRMFSHLSLIPYSELPK